MVLAYWGYKRFKFWLSAFSVHIYILLGVKLWATSPVLLTQYGFNQPTWPLKQFAGELNWDIYYRGFYCCIFTIHFIAHMWPSTGKAGQRHRKTKKPSNVHISKQVMTESRTTGHSTISSVCCLNFIVCEYSPISKGNLSGCVKSIKLVHLSKQHLKNVVYRTLSGA